MERYTAELMRVKNDKSGKCRYFLQKCGVMTRISQADFELKKDLAAGLECLTITVKRGLVRHQVTAVYYL